MPTHIDGEELVGTDDIERGAVRLDDIRLVDATLLHVGRRVVDSRGRSLARLRGGNPGSGADCNAAGPAAQPVGPDERQRVLLGVGEQAAALS